ncbi:MAG: lipopolysaccharide heptosyltransferase II [Verrucomicrobiales bacterium]
MTVNGRATGKPTRIIVRSPNPLGDACMALPAVRALRRTFADVRITLCCRENLAPVWEVQADVDDVLAFSKSRNPLQVGKLIRSRGPFDLGVLLPNSFRSALELRLGGVTNLVGYDRHQRRLLLRTAVDEPRPAPEEQHHVHRYLHLAEKAGADVGRVTELLRIPPAPMPISSGLKKIRFGVCPGAEYGNAKRYPIERYAEAIESLRERRPAVEFVVAIFGSPAERGIGDRLASMLSGPVDNRVGRTSIGGLVDELRTCHFLATNDTGTMHLAAAIGVPTVAIFGSTEPDFTSPVGDVHRVIRHKVDCSPCFLRECPIDYRCMLRIEPERVVREMEALLDAAELPE